MESRSPSRAAHEQEPRHRPCRKICLLCLVTSVLVAIVAGLSIHVLQIRQSLLASDQKYLRLWEQHQEMNRTQRQCRLQIHEPNSTLESITSENSRLDLSQTTCLKNISVLNNNVSIRENKFNHLELKCKALNEAKDQICQLLTSRKEKACSQDWIGNAGLCYFISTFESSYELAKQLCSISESKLLEISSNEEEDFVDSAVRGEDSSYWIGTCKTGKVASNVVYKVNAGKFECGECKSRWLGSCKNDQHRFICEKPVPLWPDVPEKIRDLCQNPVERT
ncbi:oxidized low-density lipoprotein receptor 1-like isoform X2 [Hypanus sabinus]|uniref:oxidized low-density lipoprotein receptor 1-like isoform X2 n=1 Tax=Hypanus sabinus TaxID=79690 RepID=UPI0028C383E9|nr:oxidized low-density lipoprotein receptor 1-like isoform X2 [Hypanus sabinus]